MRHRLDQTLVMRKLAETRSQAQTHIKLGKVTVNGEIATKPGRLTSDSDKVKFLDESYVSRGALKLASVAQALGLNFKGKIVLDVGSSTGGFTDYALRHGAKYVIAVDTGSNQMHPRLRVDSRVELHEKTDIRSMKELNERINYVLIDVSFISIQKVLPSIAKLIQKETTIVAMVKPQFETEQSSYKNKGVVKNESARRKILAGFEQWAKGQFVILDKRDSLVKGSKGNAERFYKLTLLKN